MKCDATISGIILFLSIFFGLHAKSKPRETKHSCFSFIAFFFSAWKNRDLNMVNSYVFLLAWILNTTQVIYFMCHVCGLHNRFLLLLRLLWLFILNGINALFVCQSPAIFIILCILKLLCYSGFILFYFLFENTFQILISSLSFSWQRCHIFPFRKYDFLPTSQSQPLSRKVFSFFPVNKCCYMLLLDCWKQQAFLVFLVTFIFLLPMWWIGCLPFNFFAFIIVISVKILKKHNP